MRSATVTTPNPSTRRGQTTFALDLDAITDDALELFCYHHCVLFAVELTAFLDVGFVLIEQFDYRDQRWHFLHAAADLGDDTFLDAGGIRSLATYPSAFPAWRAGRKRLVRIPRDLAALRHRIGNPIGVDEPNHADGIYQSFGMPLSYRDDIHYQIAALLNGPTAP